MFLVDTSVWIEVFRKRNTFDLLSTTNFDEIVTCLPVIQEILQGFDDERAFRTAHESMYSLPIVESPLRSDIFDEAVTLYRSARRAGLTIRSGVDCLIAACALRHSLTVMHRDRDFDSLKIVSPLRTYNIGQTSRRR